MRLIDRYAYSNRLAKVNPAAKAGLAIWVIVLCLVLNRPFVGILAILWMTLLATWQAGIPLRVFSRLLGAEGTFLLLTSLGVALSVSLSPPDQPWQWAWGPLWFSTSPDALNGLLLLMTRALGAASALNFLALTTPLVDMVGLLRRLRLPEALIDIMVVMYRFIFVLLETLARMRTAQASRLGYQAGYWRSMQNAGQLGASLFIHTMARTRQLETAVAARGFDGTLRVITPHYRPLPHDRIWVGLITITMIGARVGAAWLP